MPNLVSEQTYIALEKYKNKESFAPQIYNIHVPVHVDVSIERAKSISEKIEPI